MKTDDASSGTATAKTSDNGHEKKNDVPPPNKPAGKLTDAEYLARQADEAMKAIGRTWADMKGELAEGANPVEWARKYPWVAIGAGAVAGFVATSLLVPSKEEQALRKLAKIERALNPDRYREHHEPSGNGDSKHEDKKGDGKPHGIMGMVVRELVGAIQPAIVSLLTAGVTAKATKPDNDSGPSEGPGTYDPAGGGGYAGYDAT